MSFQRFIDQNVESLGVVGQKPGPFLKGDAGGTVTAGVGFMAGRLVAEQMDVDVMFDGIIQQIDDVAVESDGPGRAGIHGILCPGERLFFRLHHFTDPALVMTGLDPGRVDFSDDPDPAGDLHGFALSSAHAAQTGRDEELSGQIAFIGDPQHQASGVEQRIVSSVDDALWADVHPASGRHLTVIGHAQCLGPVVVVQIVVHADHQTIGDDDSRCFGPAVEQSHGMSGVQHQCLVLIQGLQILFDQLILHPVLADCTGLSVGDEFIGIQCDLKIQIVVDHDLEGLALDAVGLVFIDGFAVKGFLREIPVAVDLPLFLQLLVEFLCHDFMVLFGDVAQRVFDRQKLILF